MRLSRKDIVSIVVLTVVFFAVASVNLGFTQTPTSTATFSSGESFYLDLGSPKEVGSIYFLLKDGSYNVTSYSGSPDNWTLVVSGSSFSDYYKYSEVGFHKTTQFVRVELGQSSTEAILAEVAVTNTAKQQLTIVGASIIGSSDANVQNLIDEQNLVQLPPTYMTQTYFDEIYFARTAEQYLHLQSPYEWTHPPLGKLIQAAGIVVFGYSPFGWRFAGVIFGTLMIPIMYLLGKRIFGTWIGGFAAAFLLTFDFMHFTMARMGTVDTYVVFFNILAQLLFFTYFANVVKNGWKTSVKPLFFAVVFFALAFSSKWLVLYGAVGMLALLAAIRLRELAKVKESLSRKYSDFFDHPFLLLIGFIGIAILIYFATYIPDILTGRPILGTYGNGVIDLQFAMYNYHSTLVATHAFSSSWWAWPILVSPKGYVPLWLDISYLPNSIDSTISVMGNPAVWWVGFASMLVVIERAFKGQEILQAIRSKISKKPKVSESQTDLTPGNLGGPTSSDSMKNLSTAMSEGLPEASPIPQLETSKSPQSIAQSRGRRWDIAAIFIAVVFLFSWIPYVLISRVTFIYHFYVSVPMICLASAYMINQYWQTRSGKIITIAFFAAVVTMFVAFYPVISGMPTPVSYLQNLKWFPSWFFAP